MEEDKVVDLVLNVSKEVQDFLNNELLPIFVKLHNINPEFSKLSLN